MALKLIAASISCLILLKFPAQAAHPLKTRNLIVVTMDGMRWQEIFGGLDPALVKNRQFTRSPEFLNGEFKTNREYSSRQRLFPFIWSTVAKKGQIYGNRKLNSHVDVMNRYQFSYPGYNEIFTGFPDPKVKSNDNINNPNENVLEFLSHQSILQNKVAAFATWEAIPYILNRQRSGFYINADRDPFPETTERFKALNELQVLTPRPLEVRPDVLTYYGAREYLETQKPRVLYISFGETDEAAHQGIYDQYLLSAHSQDAMLADLWAKVQSMDEYRDQTTLIVTCDHGRGGRGKPTWVDHGDEVPESGQIWIAVMGPDTPALGEIQGGPALHQAQLATTFARFLGFDFKPAHPVQPSIDSFF